MLIVAQPNRGVAINICYAANQQAAVVNTTNQDELDNQSIAIGVNCKVPTCSCTLTASSTVLNVTNPYLCV